MDHLFGYTPSFNTVRQRAYIRSMLSIFVKKHLSETIEIVTDTTLTIYKNIMF